LATLSKVQRPELGTTEQLLEEQVDELKNRAIEKKAEIDGPSPFVGVMQSALQELDEKKVECANKKESTAKAEADLPYCEFWVKAFGDNGIRKFIIDGVIPALNAKIAHWLQFLIDGRIRLTFDNKLNDLIERVPSDGDPFVYHAMSGGERRRLNLALAPAFAHITALNSGVSSSIIFLDEVATNIDANGVIGVYNMIVDLAKEKKVFVTTHDQNLLDLLDGCETIKLVKENGFTKIVS
jgi:DNA repair exonuclease SbcCD ATPase subunit